MMRTSTGSISVTKMAQKKKPFSGKRTYTIAKADSSEIAILPKAMTSAVTRLTHIIRAAGAVELGGVERHCEVRDGGIGPLQGGVEFGAQSHDLVRRLLAGLLRPVIRLLGPSLVGVRWDQAESGIGGGVDFGAADLARFSIDEVGGECGGHALDPGLA